MMGTLGTIPEFIKIQVMAQVDPCWLYLFGGLLVLVNLYKWVKRGKWGQG